MLGKFHEKSSCAVLEAMLSTGINSEFMTSGVPRKECMRVMKLLL